MIATDFLALIKITTITLTCSGGGSPARGERAESDVQRAAAAASGQQSQRRVLPSPAATTTNNWRGGLHGRSPTSVHASDGGQLRGRRGWRVAWRGGRDGCGRGHGLWVPVRRCADSIYTTPLTTDKPKERTEEGTNDRCGENITGGASRARIYPGVLFTHTCNVRT